MASETERNVTADERMNEQLVSETERNITADERMNELLKVVKRVHESNKETIDAQTHSLKG